MRSIAVVTGAFALSALTLVAAGCGVVTQTHSMRSSAASVAVDPAVAAGCRRGGGISQAMNGHVSGCIQVGSLTSGPHTVVLDDLLNFPVAKPPIRLGPHPSRQIREIVYPPEPIVALSVVPSSGPPGTEVTITGRLSSPLPRTPLGAGHPTFCWDGCRFGLRYQGVPAHWTSSRIFSARLVVPRAPWIEGSPVRVMPLRSGTHRIALQCLVFGKLCAYERVEGAVHFDLRVEKQTPWCMSPSTCAQLTLTPKTALPGQWVTVSGFAPLVSVVGSGQAVAFDFAVLKGAPTGSEVKLGTFKAAPSALVGATELDVLAAPTFASLPDLIPIARVTAGLSPISAQPDAASTVAWCGASGVEISRGGATSAVPTKAAGAALRRLRLRPLPPLSCDAVALAGPPADPAAVIAAAFPAVGLQYSAPPFSSVALRTEDRGRSWQAVPVPPRASILGFGGFRYGPGGAEAVFATAVPNGKAPGFPDLDPTRPLAELSSNGGSRWHAAPLGCPSAGPCVTLGAYLPGDCAMDVGLQPLLHSIDGGIRWAQPPLLDQLQACAESELVATSGQDALLVDSMSQFPLQATTDGGASWHDVSIPPAPGEQSYEVGLTGNERSYTLGPGPGGITALPDGDLLLTGGNGYRGRWELLRRGSSTWCAARSPSARTQSLPQLSPLAVIGPAAWWLTGDGRHAPAARHVHISSIAC